MAYKDAEKQREQSRRYYAANGAQTRARNKRWHEANREYLRAYNRQRYIDNRDERRAYVLFQDHGLRPDDWAAMWAAQNGKCYLCGLDLATLKDREVHVDHDHACCGQGHSCAVCRRGLACQHCNNAIGHVRDDVARLRRMADALEAAQADVERRKLTAPSQLTLELEA